MEEIEALLQSLQTLKPPGITKTKIDAITQKCFENVQSDAAIVQNIVHQFNSSAATHKLGVFYVLDSVSRQWLDRARKTGQAVSRNAAPGTFASGVQKITDVLPGLMTDLIRSAPENQKEKISKLLDIWERGQTFPLDMLAGFKQQLNNPQSNSHAPTRDAPNGFNVPSAPAGPTNTQTLAPAFTPVAPQDAGALLAALVSFGQPNAAANPIPTAPPALPFAQNMIPPPPPGFVLPPPPAPANGQSAALPVLSSGVNPLAAQIMQALQEGRIQPDQAVQVINAISAAQNAGVPFPPPPGPAVSQVPPVAQNGAQQDRFEQNGNRYRNRSRSPDMNRRRRSPVRRSPPNRRDSPTYGVYDPNANTERSQDNRHDRGDRGRGRAKNRGGRNDRNEYRQRTPPPPRRQPSPAGNGSRGGSSSKFIDWDASMPRDHIKVLSRTLFIGGASGTEGEIRSIFSRFGKVQTCIVNQDKRHAFVKMLTRPDAVAAKEGMDSIQDPMAVSKARQTRWGVGFGPRDCSDYNTGISVIPISRLTDADRKWVVTAENGGTGGLPLQEGMVIEEPDIEIGAGVSSKAISRRVPPETGRGRGGYGGRGDRGGRGGFDSGRYHRQDRPPIHEQRHISPRPEPTVAVPPAVPGFGFQLPGMPNFGAR
ncbi:hypothetical protein K458DRAFT_414623 [Lentithecium fluviatile CBS 122367]|uniref:RNA binding protein Nrd1 n=1 Tax=Lentithecium fluviatile CBS 122367 TaxID=1168545 RepID=A0A6G1JFN9_9PLEO|nr:hypothetical protein K458DRAFT_414623 [Lentithecium fluviatile CBS 122367]